MSRQTIRFLAALGGVTVSTAIIGCADAPVGPLTGVEFRSELVLSYDPCQHSAHFLNCEIIDSQTSQGWMVQLSQGWMADPPPVCLQMKAALDNLVDFGDLQIGDGSYAGLYGVSDLGGDRATLDRSLNFTDGVINDVGLFTVLHEALHMAGYSHNNPQHPQYLSQPEFEEQVRSCNGVGTPPS